tara:strand:+ start:35 stop:442 length:408 start_codon:yes stop_codon:yes gene_type:complete
MIQINHLSIRIRLEDIIKDINYEKKVLENIRRCSRLVGDQFKVVFWNINVSDKECESFVKRNEKLLFEVNTRITNKFTNVWFLIDSKESDESKFRYKFKGDILNGIVNYLKIFNVRKDREDSYESGDNWKPKIRK